MPRSARVPGELACGVFRGSAAIRSGLLSPAQLFRGPWTRVFADLYVHAEIPVTPTVRASAAALLVPDAVVTGVSAATLYGLDLDPGEETEVTVPPGTGVHPVAGLRIRRAALDPADVTRRQGIRLTTPVATAARLGQALEPTAAVAALDQLVQRRLVSLDDVRAAAACARGPGSARARRAAALADGLAESPQESRLRLILHRSGLPRPVAQHTIRCAGEFIARVDFAWPHRQVAAEYDGYWHAGQAQFVRDRIRLNRLQAAGWRVVFVTAPDLADPDRIIAELARALS